jgi:calcium-dependent protein kinase
MKKSQIRRKDRIQREISFLKELDHPSIIKLYDVFEDEEKVEIVTEICQGGELFDQIVEKANASKKLAKNISRDEQEQPQTRQLQLQPACFGERDAARIIYSLLSAVSYLHKNDIIHRDIKPENILFTDKDTNKSPIKLIDFGLSIRHTKDCPPLSNTVGTSYYMAPELLDGEYDRSCDMWSIGVLAYIMLSGRPPFNGSTDPVIFKKIRSGRYRMDSPLWDGISDYAKDFIRCLLDMDPNRRWTAHMALNHAWLMLEMMEDMMLMPHEM